MRSVDPRLEINGIFNAVPPGGQAAMNLQRMQRLSQFKKWLAVKDEEYQKWWFGG